MTAHGDWWIGLDTWVLQDGNYTDFAAGERRQFAVEFGYRRDRRPQRCASQAAPSCRHTGSGSSYEVTGQVIRASADPGPRDAFVVDFGIRAYSHWLKLDDLTSPAVGEWVHGALHLGVDPFFYIDELAGLSGMPPLIYTWTVAEIELDDRGSWRSVDRTRMWDEDSNYRLRCRLEDVAPTESLRATGAASPYGPLEAPAP